MAADDRPIQILERWCLNNGSSLAGRMQSFRFLTGTVQKPAVLVSERSQLLYFPLSGIRDPRCIWICFSAVLSWHSAGADTIICFFDGSEITVPVERRVVAGQIKRCGTFLERINSDGRFPVLHT